MRRKDMPIVHTIMARTRKYRKGCANNNRRVWGGKRSEILPAKIKEILRDLRKCELYPMISGYHETKNWFGDKTTFAIHGNPGCEIWFRRFIDLSRAGEIWELNEEGRHLKVTRNEEDYRQLARRFGRYKKERADAIGEIRFGQSTGAIPDRVIGWKEAHKRVPGKRKQTG